MMKATARHPLGLRVASAAPPPPPLTASCSGTGRPLLSPADCGRRCEAMDAASGLPPSHMFTRNPGRSPSPPGRARAGRCCVLCFCCSGGDLHGSLQLRIRYLYPLHGVGRSRKVCRCVTQLLPASFSARIIAIRVESLLGGRKHSDYYYWDKTRNHKLMERTLLLRRLSSSYRTYSSRAAGFQKEKGLKNYR